MDRPGSNISESLINELKDKLDEILMDRRKIEYQENCMLEDIQEAELRNQIKLNESYDETIADKYRAFDVDTLIDYPELTKLEYSSLSKWKDHYITILRSKPTITTLNKIIDIWNVTIMINDLEVEQSEDLGILEFIK